MAPDRPAWIVKDLASLLGLDQDSVSQLVLPDLEGYTSETKLKSHLQDFLGPSVPAKTFISKFIGHRFPRLPTSEAPPVATGPLKPLFSQPPAFGASASTSSASTGGFTRQPPPHVIPDALEAAFGPGGKLYQKNRDADLSSFSGSTKQNHGGGSGSASGTTTPKASAMRSAGALTVVDARSKNGVGMTSGGSQKGKQRAVEKIWDAPKSKEVKKLEKMLEDLKAMQAGEGKVKRVDEGKECFCQARLHPLSPHTPQCSGCGLIQCHLQPPDRACPSCFRPLVTPSALARLLLRIQSEIQTQLDKEQDARDAVKRAELRKAEEAAAFPYLAGAAGGPAPVADTGHKVLTIGKGKGRITLTTTTTHTIAAAGPAEPERYSEAVISRPRSPPFEPARTEKELAKHLKWRKEEDRPWGDMKAAKKGEGWAYVPPQIIEIIEGETSGRRKGKKGRGTEGVNGRAVPGAAGIPA